MNFSHIAIPEVRHPTAKARSSLNQLLGFEDNDDLQDWARHFADDSRLDEFLLLYQEQQSCDDTQFLLMDLILASAENAMPAVPNEAQWQVIEALLSKQYPLHAWTIWEWADIDEDTGISSNDFQISRRMQNLLQRMFDETAATGVVSPAPAQPSFLEFWNMHFEGHKPVGHHLRKSLHPRWTRFHSLRQSKRYAETQEEWACLFERHNRIASEVLGEGSRCWLVLCRDLEDSYLDNDDHLDRFDFNRWFSWWENYDLGEAQEWPVYAAETVWQAGQFDNLIRRIAKWEECFMMWVSQETHAIFSPYDGGMDVILPSGRQASILSAKFAEWKPFNDTGM